MSPRDQWATAAEALRGERADVLAELEPLLAQAVSKKALRSAMGVMQAAFMRGASSGAVYGAMAIVELGLRDTDEVLASLRASRSEASSESRSDG